MQTVDKFIDYFEQQLTNIDHQCSWDFSGKQIYLGNHDVNKVCVALDPSREVIEQAIQGDCQLLITHHPFFFAPIKGIDVKKINGELMIKAIQNKLSILSYHTNLDMAQEGINQFLIKKIGAKESGFLKKEGHDDYVKFVVFTPKEHAQKVLEAAYSIGAGKMGNYQECSFSSTGLGSFKPLAEANPFIGSANIKSTVEEVRQEILVPANKVKQTISVIKQAHPYEVPAIDIINVQGYNEYGLGNIGILERNYSLPELIDLLKERLNINSVRCNMHFIDRIKKIAICSGSGASLWKSCLHNGINVFITGDVKHHDAVDARDAGVCLIDVGHFSSERIYMEFLAQCIEETFRIEVLLAIEQPSLIDF